MSALSLLYKAIAVGILLLSLTIHAKPGTILQQPIDSNILYKSQRAMGQDLNQEDCMPTTSQENDINGAAEQWWWSSSSKDESQGSDGYLKSFSHPAFPEYSMRYKTPEICDPSVKQISGYLDIGSNKHFFFWFFESRSSPKEDLVILWLEGGPACSTMLGVFVAIGYEDMWDDTLNDHGNDTTLNEHSWNNNANLLFLDQPLNTGFSYGENGAMTSKAASKDIYSFLQLFFTEFPEYSNLDFHIAGQSYGGHFVPAAAAAEINYNNKVIQQSTPYDVYASHLLPINLKSIMIGNGLTNALIQYKYLSKMACENSYGPALDQVTCGAMDEKYPACAALIKRCYTSQNLFTCMPAYIQCNKDLGDPYVNSGKNMYDVRKTCDQGGMCYAVLDGMQNYLNRPEVLEAIGSRFETFESCNDDLHEKIATNDWMRPIVDMIPELLEDGIRILSYAGDADFICNWMGIKAWMLNMPWSGHDEFVAAKDTAWFSPTANEHGGELRQTKDGRFAFLRLYDSGHVAPMDRRDYAIDMLNQWLGEELA